MKTIELDLEGDKMLDSYATKSMAKNEMILCESHSALNEIFHLKNPLIWL